MRGLADHHMHLLPDDARLEAAAWSLDHLRPYVETARARGVEALAITEHVYRFDAIDGVAPDPGREPAGYWAEQHKTRIDAYVAGLQAAIDAGLPLLVGLELDWLEGAHTALAAIAASQPWDVVLGSVHWVAGGAVDHPRYSVWATGASAEDVYRRYYEALWASAASGLYDVITHPDLVKYFGHRVDAALLGELHEETARVLAAADVCIEINTAGLRKPIGELYPVPDLLERCARHGVPLSLGSDAHVAGDVGRDFDRALALARASGYTTTSRFRGRQRTQVPLV